MKSKQNLPKHTYLELSFMGLEDQSVKARLRDFLISQRIPPLTIAENEIKKKFIFSVYLKSLGRSDAILEAFKHSGISRLKTRVKLLGPKHWLEKWHEDYHTQRIGRKFDVGPIWERKLYRAKKGKQGIFLNPKSAFGSGQHETTKLMVRLLESLEGKFEDYLDLGTGTGILSIVAGKLGAQRLDGIDIDGPSVREATSNIKLNSSVPGTLKRQDLAKFKPRRRYDLVGANLFSKLLVAQKRKIRAGVRLGGHLAVSGILKSGENRFLREFKVEGIRRLKVLRGRRWIAVLYRRTD